MPLDALTAGAPVPSQMSLESTDYVFIPVRAYANGVAYNPTADVVQIAFINGWAPPGSLSWNNAAWAGTVPATNGPYLAQVLVGPGTVGVVNLAVGTWNTWIKVTDNPAIPVRSTGTVTITP